MPNMSSGLEVDFQPQIVPSLIDRYHFASSYVNEDEDGFSYQTHLFNTGKGLVGESAKLSEYIRSLQLPPIIYEQELPYDEDYDEVL